MTTALKVAAVVAFALSAYAPFPPIWTFLLAVAALGLAIWAFVRAVREWRAA